MSRNKWSNTDKDFGEPSVFYRDYYPKMFSLSSRGLLSFLWKYPHRTIENKFKGVNTESILEVGAGRGEHLQACDIKFEKYTMLDLEKFELPELNKNPRRFIVQLIGNAEETAQPDSTFDRVIATCVIAHLHHPEKALAEWRRIVKDTGYISIYIPCEPGIALRVFRKFTTSRRAAELGFNGYEMFIAREHINDASRILRLIGYIFREDKISFVYRPFFLKSWYFNLFIIAHIKVKKTGVTFDNQ